jgi:uncharacterized protein
MRPMSKSKHTVTWFEIPATDLSRATAFYSTLLEVELEPVEFGGVKMAIFPGSGGEGGEPVVHGALVMGEGYVPGATGPLIYLNGGDDLAGPLSRVEGAGGAVLMAKTSIGPHGFMAVLLDTEGNKVALHSAG